MTLLEIAAKAYHEEHKLWSYRDYRNGAYEIVRGEEIKFKGNWRDSPGRGLTHLERLSSLSAMRAAFKSISTALELFEKNAETMRRMGMDHAFWSGRLEAIQDIKEVFEAKAEEGEEVDAKAATPAGAANPATRP